MQKCFVKQVRRTGIVPTNVYNLATASHNYFANGILVHNCDDPNNPDVGNNTPVLTKVEKRFRDYSFGRKNSKTAAIIVVQQRCAKWDVSGVIRDKLNTGDWQILTLPTCAKIYTEIKFPISSDRTIIRQPGDFLIPQRHGAVEDAEAKNTLGAAMYASRHSQEPMDEASQVFKMPRVAGLPANYQLALSLDSTFGSTSKSASFACLGLWAIARPNFYLIDVWRKKAGIIQTKQALLDMRARHEHLGVIGQILIELKANGSSLIEELSLEIPGIIPISPKESKRARAEAIAPLFESGNIFLVDGAWNQDYLLELADFPDGANDDQVDMTSQLVAYYLKKWRSLNNLSAIATASFVS